MSASTEQTYLVEAMSCGHCRAAVTEQVERLAGVSAVDVDLDTKRVVVHGEAINDAAVREAIAAAGYEASP
ncbi:MAG: heavy-metal-associated domain-containing protein [Solirubrobacteraceae bacterium]